MDSRLRLLYAVAGHDHRQYCPPLHGEKPGGEPAAYAYGDCRLRADGCRHAACQRLAGGQSGREKYLLYRHRAVHHRLAVLRSGQHPRPAGHGARAAGRWRGDDGARRAVNGDEDCPARAVHGGDDLCHPARPGGAAAGPGAGRDAGGIRLVALDFLNQPAGGHHRRDCHPGADAELHNADASLRFLRFHSAGSGHGHAHPGARRTKGAGDLFPHARCSGRPRHHRDSVVPVACQRKRSGLVQPEFV